MRIGKPGKPATRIARAYPDRVEVRGRDLTTEVMGRLGFVEYFYLLLTGEEPTDDQRFFLDLLLVSIAEHGMMPTNIAARMTLPYASCCTCSTAALPIRTGPCPSNPLRSGAIHSVRSSDGTMP
jgi:citrate synthase